MAGSEDPAYRQSPHPEFLRHKKGTLSKGTSEGQSAQYCHAVGGGINPRRRAKATGPARGRRNHQLTRLVAARASRHVAKAFVQAGHAAARGRPAAESGLKPAARALSQPSYAWPPGRTR